MSVLLSGEESDLIFIDHSTTEMTVSVTLKNHYSLESNSNPCPVLLSYTDIPQPENCLSSYDPHGYCVIYSSADRGSFNLAERVLQGLWTTENIAQKAVILVANKADLARSRAVTSEGRWHRVKGLCNVISLLISMHKLSLGKLGNYVRVVRSYLRELNYNS